MPYFPAYSARHRGGPPTVVVTGTPSVGGVLTATAPTATSYQWMRRSDFGGGGTYSAIIGATSSTYTQVTADMGYDIVCDATNTYGTTRSNSKRYDPVNVAAVVELWDIWSLSAGLLSTWTGSKLHMVFGQVFTSKSPIVSATSFNGKTGITADGSDDFLATTTNFDLSAFSDLRVVCGLKDTTSSTGIFIEHTTSVGTQAGGFLVDPNDNPNLIGIYSSGTAGGFGGAQSPTEALISPCVMSFGFTHSNTSGATFMRKGGTPLTLTTVVPGCTNAPFASAITYLFCRAGTSFPWTGTIGGALIVMSGSAQDSDLVDAEAYVKNATGL